MVAGEAGSQEAHNGLWTLSSREQWYPIDMWLNYSMQGPETRQARLSASQGHRRSGSKVRGSGHSTDAGGVTGHGQAASCSPRACAGAQKQPPLLWFLRRRGLGVPPDKQF